MTNNKSDNLFITFEGIDGSGKSTVLKAMTPFFKALEKDRGFEVLITREPGAFLSAQKNSPVRDLLLDPSVKMSAKTEALFFAADRRDHLEKLIWPTLKRGGMVVSDRYIDSSLAYQGARDGMSIDTVLQLQEWATDKFWPDLTIFFDISPSDAAKRVDKRGEADRIEKLGEAYRAKVYANYQELLKRYPKRIVSIDATQSETMVISQVRRVIEKALGFCVLVLN